MALEVNASLDFIKFPASEKPIWGKNVYNCIGKIVTQFPDLPVTLAILLDTNDKLSNAQMAALSGDKVAASKVKGLEKLWNTQYKKTAKYVSMVADGNVDLIIDAGFKPTKGNRQKKAAPDTVTGFNVDIDMAKGSCKAACDAEELAKGYVYIAAPESVSTTIQGDTLVIDVNGTLVHIKTETQSRTYFTNLPSGQKQCISMYAFNSSGCAALTEKQSVIPQ